MRNFISHIKEGKRYYAVEITRTDAKAPLAFISLQKKKNTLEVTEQCDDVTLKTLSGLLKKNTPLFVVINTPQVLTKVIANTGGDDLAAVNGAFPNIKTEDFYYERTVSGSKCTVAVCRKEQVHTLLRECREANLHIAGFSLGILPVSSIKDFIPAYVISLPHTEILLKDREIEAIGKSEQPQSKTYEINGITLENSYLLGFGAVLSHIVKNGRTRSDLEAVNAGLLSELHHKRFFSFFLKAGLGVLLAVLLLNFFFFNHYYTKAEALRDTVTVKSADKNQVPELNRRVNEKQQRVTAMLAAVASKSSFYIDNIAAALPSAVLLSAIIYQPVEGRIQPESEIAVKPGILSISGASKDSEAFSRWIETMEKWDWIARVDIRDYDYSNASTSLFTLQITLQHE